MKQLLAICFLLLTTGCALTQEKITAQDSTQSTLNISNPDIVNDLQSATWNLDEAMRIGALPANDPAAACLHNVLKQAGIEVTPGETEEKSFIPKRDGVASSATVLYIAAQQAQRGGQRLIVSVECKALVGTFVIDGIHAVKNRLPILNRQVK